jgi:ABC-type transport system involved in cytochrome c biogenesis permease subunit
MDYLYHSVWLFNVATFSYLAAAIVMTFHLVKPGQKIWLRAFYLLSVVVVLSHTLALAFRWMEAGFDRPPWTNLYESLVFFTWGLGLLGSIVVWKYRTYFLTTILYPLAFAGMGLASLVQDKSITPLVPALQSYWIKIHVVMAVLAYPAFIIAGVVSLAYLFKANVKMEKLGIGFALAALFSLVVVGWGDVYGDFVYQIPQITWQNGMPFKVPLDPTAASIQWFQIQLDYVPHLFWLTTFLYVLSMFYAFGALKDLDNQLWKKIFKIIHVAAFLSYEALIFVIYFHILTNDQLALQSNPYQMAVLWIGYLVQIVFLIHLFFPKAFNKVLPKAEWLDELAYQVTLFAFPFMTLLLITGAVWAYSAWGRYWGWDPKETCALITWLIFAGYLHSRKYFGKDGAPSAVINLIGAVSVFFTFLGANLLLSGLHSYGAQ